MQQIDLRSDTVTRPTPGMREAMLNAEVGDDVYGDDPTVNELQEYAADLFGFEEALFTCSGTQANLIALLAHCERGDEYLVGQTAHTYKYEGGGAAVLAPSSRNPSSSVQMAPLILRRWRRRLSQMTSTLQKRDSCAWKTLKMVKRCHLPICRRHGTSHGCMA